jgi:tetratricopeptide (TPR) repeat protein
MPAVKEWHTQPIFVSSTFRDMHAERDHLAHVVFPALEERLRERRIDLVSIDLRWGVETLSVEEGERELHVLKVCLAEIERSRPFFIGLLGDRYGWMPPSGRMQAAVDEAGFQTDVSGKSITALEIEYGVLADPEQRARSFFYFRRPLPYDEMTCAAAAVFSDEYVPGPQGAEAHERLQALKERIERRMPDRVRHYRAHWDPVDERVTGLEAFGQRVLEDLWADLEAETRVFAAIAPASWQEQERATLDEFVHRQVGGFVGRGALLDRLLEVATGAGGARRGVSITGEAGMGKSALFAALHRRLVDQHDVLLLAHSAGISTRSTKVDTVLRRWIEELATHLGIPDPAEGIERREKLEEQFALLLSEAAAEATTVLLLDAVDQFEPTPVARHLTWLPDPWPANIRLIATGRPGAATIALSRLPGMETRELAPLGRDEAREIVRQVCRRYHRTVHDAIVTALLDQRLPSGEMAAGNPLWLQLTTEALLLLDQDDFARLGEFVGSPEEKLHALLLSTARSFPPRVPALYATLLERTEDAYGEVWAREFANLLAVSRQGLREADLRALLPRRTGESWDELGFATLRRGFRSHLVQRGAAGEWDYTHAQARQAVLDRNLTGPDERRAVHAALADHLLALPADDPLHRDETMVHLIGADDRRRAASYYGGAISAEERDGATRALAARLLEGSTRDPNPGLTWATALLDIGSHGTSIVERLCRRYTEHLSSALRDDLPVSQQIALMTAVEATLEVLRSEQPDSFAVVRTLAAARSTLGDLQRRKGELATARHCYEGVLDLADVLHRLAADNADVLRNLARTHAALGDLDTQSGTAQQAQASYARAREMVEDLVDRMPDSAEDARNLEVICGREAMLCQDLGDMEGALRLARQALYLADGFVRLMPDNVTARRDLSVSQERMGTLLQQMGNLRGAREHFEEALACRRDLLRRAPDSMQLARDVWLCRTKLGLLHQAAGDLEQSKAHLDQALHVARIHLERMPNSVMAQRDVANTYQKLGTVHQEAGDLMQAQRCLEQSLTLAQALQRQMPESAEALQDLAVTQRSMATLYAQRGDLAEVETALRQSLQLSKTLCQKRPDSREAARGVYLSCSRLGALAAQQGNAQKALALSEQALGLARALHRQGPSGPQTEEDLADALRGIGLLHLKTGQVSRAQEAYEESVTLAHDLFQRFPENAERARDLVKGLVGAAQAMAAAGRGDRAQQYLARCYDPLEVLHRVGGLDHPYFQQLWRELESRRRSTPSF